MLVVLLFRCSVYELFNIFVAAIEKRHFIIQAWSHPQCSSSQNDEFVATEGCEDLK